MSSYHIAKDGKQAGPIDEEAVRQQIAAGTLNASDLCWCEGMADWQSIGTVFNFAQKAGAPPPLASPTGAAASPHQLTAFPVAVAVLLHYVTFGIFTLVWLNLMHGKMCRVRADDPSAGKAVGFCFIPFFNLYWIFFTYRRLCLRVAEQRGLYGLPPGNLRGLATTACIFQVIPYINFLLSYTLITPIFIGMMQSSVNQLARTSATTAPRATLTVSSAPERGMSGGAIAAIICACLIPVTGLLAAIAIPSFVKARSQAQLNACMNNLRQISAAKEQWGLENKASATDAPSDMNALVGPTLYLKNTPVCPVGGAYKIGALSDESSCTIHGTLEAPMAR